MKKEEASRLGPGGAVVPLALLATLGFPEQWSRGPKPPPPASPYLFGGASSQDPGKDLKGRRVFQGPFELSVAHEGNPRDAESGTETGIYEPV
jgi:hypothetical protein